MRFTLRLYSRELENFTYPVLSEEGFPDLQRRLRLKVQESKTERC